MIASTPVDHIAELLAGAAYRRLAMPLEIGGLQFDLAGAFVGTGSSPDLILIADTAFEEGQRIQRKVEGIARAMDVVGSKRPLTIVLAGPRPASSVIDAMARVSRVLPIGTSMGDGGDVSLRNWLAVLMPLRLPEPSASIADPLAEIASQLGALDARVAALTKTAGAGEDAVASELCQLISLPLLEEELGLKP